MKEPIESLGISKGKLEAVIEVNSGCLFTGKIFWIRFYQLDTRTSAGSELWQEECFADWQW